MQNRVTRRLFSSLLTAFPALAQSYSPFDLVRLQIEAQKNEEERERLDAANRAAIALRERQRAYWALTDALCKAEPSINDPHVMDARAVRLLLKAWKRFSNSLKD